MQPDVTRDRHESSLSAHSGGAIISGVDPRQFWANTVFAVLGFSCGVIGLVMVLFITGQYQRELAVERRLHTQAVDEYRMEQRALARQIGMENTDTHDHEVTK